MPKAERRRCCFSHEDTDAERVKGVCGLKPPHPTTVIAAQTSPKYFHVKGIKPWEVLRDLDHSSVKQTKFKHPSICRRRPKHLRIVSASYELFAQGKKKVTAKAMMYPVWGLNNFPKR